MGKRGVGATLHNVADGGDLAEGNDTRQRELHGGEHADGRAKERGEVQAGGSAQLRILPQPKLVGHAQEQAMWRLGVQRR